MQRSQEEIARYPQSGSGRDLGAFVAQHIATQITACQRAVESGVNRLTVEKNEFLKGQDSSKGFLFARSILRSYEFPRTIYFICRPDSSDQSRAGLCSSPDAARLAADNSTPQRIRRVHFLPMRMHLRRCAYGP
jgi:hypothetical protein